MGADNSRDESLFEGTSESKQLESKIDQLQFLTAHKRLGEYSLVRHLEKLDSSRFISASSDGTILVWYTKTGALLDVIEHYGPSTTPANLPVTGLKVLLNTTLLTGGADKKIRVWDLPRNNIDFDDMSHKTKLRHTLSLHHGGVKCFCEVSDDGLFVSAGTCNLVGLWDALDGVLIGQMCLRNADNVQSMIALAPYENQVRVLIGTDNSKLIILNFQLKDEYVLRTDHQESVQILVRLKETLLAVCFLSASIDGLILGWRDDGRGRPRVIFRINEEVLLRNLTAVKSKFRKANGKEMENESKEWEQRVWAVAPLGYGNYAASIGPGFVVFNEEKGTIACCKKNGHRSYITHLAKIVLNGRLILVTGSVDSVVKLWDIGTPKCPGHPSWVGGRRKTTSFVVKIKSTSFEPISELKAHSGSITAMLGLEDYCFASADEKANVILWKSHAVVSEQVRTKIRQNLCL